MTTVVARFWSKAHQIQVPLRTKISQMCQGLDRRTRNAPLSRGQLYPQPKRLGVKNVLFISSKKWFTVSTRGWFHEASFGKDLFSKGRFFLFLCEGHLKIQFHKASFKSPYRRTSLFIKVIKYSLTDTSLN